jgi:hypothetical protein
VSKTELLALTERLQLWGKTLLSLAEPDKSQRLVEVLNSGDGAGLTALVGDRLFAQGTCIDVVDTLTRMVNFGPRQSEERCEVIARLRAPNPSTVNYKVYRLNDGRLVAVTEADWWAYYDRAAQDQAWLAQNRDLLRALGIITCVIVEVSGTQLVTIDRSRTMCFPGVTRPWD